jgi:hypothetical protein
MAAQLGDEPGVPPAAEIVDRPGHDLLPGAGVPHDQDGVVDPRRAGDEVLYDSRVDRRADVAARRRGQELAELPRDLPLPDGRREDLLQEARGHGGLAGAPPAEGTMRLGALALGPPPKILEQGLPDAEEVDGWPTPRGAR